MKKTALSCLITAIIFSHNSYAEEDLLSDISLEDLLSTKITIASGNKGMTLRESPGIVSLITREEIVNSGARDLIDVLNLVPGISFGVDVQGVVGIAARGNWAHEGKISLMIDDMEMNELSFATLQFGNHYPVDNIERIELIRGPGSAIYGGFAEMGVIKIVTKNAETLKHSEGSILVGKMNDGGGRTSASLAVGHQFDEGSISANVYYTQGDRSDRDFSDFYDDTYNMDGNSDLDTVMFNVGLKYNDFEGRVLVDRYDVTQRDIFFVNAPYAVKQSFESDFLQLKYNFQLSDDLSLTPEVIIKNQQPWKSTSQGVLDLEALDPDSYGGQFFDEELSRTTMKLIGSYDINETDNLIFGVSHYEDEDKTVNVKFDNTAVFAQSVLSMDWGNITLGARWVDHSEAGSSFLPRLGYTNIWDKTHLKVLWSTAFRAPVVQNILDFNDPTGTATKIKAENTEVLEIEMGYQFSSNFFVTANLYDISIEDPIVYYFVESDSYRNYPKVGTRGFEIEGKYKESWGYMNMTYSYYQVSDNQVDQYAIRAVDPDLDDDFVPILEEDQLLGTPSSKLTLNVSYEINDDWIINPSLIFEGKKYAYIDDTPDEEQLVPGELDSVTLFNFNVIRKNIIGDNADLQFGVFNLSNDDIDYVQPYYDGFHAPYPGPSREVFARLNVRF